MSKESQQETNLLDVLIVLAKHKFFIFKLVFAITLIALIISLIWPHTYKSSSTFIPSTQQQTLAGGISGILGGAMQMPMDFPEVNPEVLLNILNGRELREQVINEFNFQEIYRSDIMEELLTKLDSDFEVVENREGGFGFNPIFSVQLAFYSKEPDLSYEVNRYILDLLDQKVRRINAESSDELLHILEERYERSLRELKMAEDTLQAFQEKYGILEIEDQALQTIQLLGELKTSSIENEIRISVLREVVSEDNAELRNLVRSKEEYDRQFERMLQKSDRESVDLADQAGRHPLLDLPELGMTYLRLFREVEIQSMVLEAVYPQYESQKMVVESSRRGIQIIDPPVIPTYKDSPKRAFIVLGGMFFSIFLALVIVFFREKIEKGRESDSEEYRKMQQLAEHLRFRRGKSAGASSDS